MKKETLLQNRVLISFTALLIVSLACGIGPVEVIPPTATPSPTATSQPTSTPLPTPKPIPSVSELSSATVQILAFLGGEPIWSGSGTIISSDGLILTNAHIASPHAPGLTLLYGSPVLLAEPTPDEFRIALVESADQPPIESYLAEVVNADGVLDLALLRIVSNIDGDPVDANGLELPFVELGDSGEVQLGDSIRIFGFPGVGGETITLTQGTVSGFESQDPVGDRVWIKTDSDISHGNSGGLAVNEAGQIIGVPTRGESGQGDEILGRLSSINFAKPLIDAALADQEYDPYVKDGTGNEAFTLTTWAMDYDKNGCPIDPVEHYPSGSLALIGVFSYQSMSDGEELLVAYLKDNNLVYYEISSWDGGSSGECHSIITNNGDQSMPDGDYQFQVFAGSGLPLVGSADTAVGAIQTGDIKVKGRVYDSLTNKGIPDAIFFVLNPGVDTAEWINNDAPKSDVYTFARTNSKGNYALPVSLERLVEYPVLVYADGYYLADGIFRFGQTAPVQITSDFSLEPQ